MEITLMTAASRVERKKFLSFERESIVGSPCEQREASLREASLPETK